MPKSTLRKGIFITGLLGIGMLCGWLLAKTTISMETGARPIALRQGGYTYINPLLLCYNSPRPTGELSGLSTNITKFAEPFQANKTLTKFSLYFNDLTNGQWTGISENDTYNPASLLKLPILIAYLKQAEADPELLSRKILYTGTPNPKEIFNDLKTSTKYTVEELLTAMIKQSDNSAKDLLLDSIDLKDVTGIFRDLGVEIKADTENPYVISPRNYSRFFRILYNATYDNRELSEKGLALLTNTSFKDGLVAGVPADVPVAHKFGQYTPSGSGSDINTPWELHDCGIIYHARHPYLLCVMTKGTNFDTLKEVIKGISSIVYKAVDNDYR